MAKVRVRTAGLFVWVAASFIFMLIMGFSLYAVYRQDKQREELEARCDTVTQAQVVDVTSEEKTRMRTHRRNGRTRTTTEYYTQYTYQIEYEAEGQKYRTKEINENTQWYSEGDNIELKYDSDDPAVCYIHHENDGKNFGNMIVMTFIMAIAFGGFILVAVIFSIIAKKQKSSGGNSYDRNYYR